MYGFQEVGVAEMRQIEGGWNPFKKAWNGIKKAAGAVWNALKKPYIGIPVVIALGGGLIFGGSRWAGGPNSPYQPSGAGPGSPREPL